MYIRSNRRGFTLVELLVVIVVIAILGIVTVVTYNGAQQRARNSQMAQVIKTYREAMISYKVFNKVYPTGNANAGTCLGSNYLNDKCWFNDVSENAGFNAALLTVMGGSSSTVPMPPINATNLKGAFYVSATMATPWTLDGVPMDFIIYSIEGTDKCPVGPVASDDGNPNNLNLMSAVPTSGQTFASTASNPVQCWLPLP